MAAAAAAGWGPAAATAWGSAAADASWVGAFWERSSGGSASSAALHVQPAAFIVLNIDSPSSQWLCSLPTLAVAAGIGRATVADLCMSFVPY